MALDFGQQLFKREGLEQETGELKERWGQGGSNIKNIYGNNIEDEVMYTVTAGKTLFVTSITIYQGENGVTTYYTLFYDGDGGDFKAPLSVLTEDGYATITFTVPIQFSTNVYVSATNYGDITIQGWEE